MYGTVSEMSLAEVVATGVSALQVNNSVFVIVNLLLFPPNLRLTITHRKVCDCFANLIS
jgi:hypothetical protein